MKFSATFSKPYRVVAKNVTSLNFVSSPSQMLLVADRYGDIHAYDIVHNQISDKPRLLIGHLSLTVAMVSLCEYAAGGLTNGQATSLDGKFLISCDRDSKIRVSHMPNTFKISSYCLGHTR